MPELDGSCAARGRGNIRVMVSSLLEMRGREMIIYIGELELWFKLKEKKEKIRLCGMGLSLG